MTVDTRRFEIQPLDDGALSEAATFLDRWRSAGDHGPPASVQAGPSSTARRLQWMLMDHPLRSEGPHGLCIRDGAGTMTGLLLAFPSAFRAGDRRLLALCSGSYFVEPRARTLGFYLFKRHLARRGYAFF